MMTQEELQKYYQSKYPLKSALNQEELEGYLNQEWQFKTGGKLNYLTMFR